jgi:hypothetical protein
MGEGNQIRPEIAKAGRHRGVQAVGVGGMTALAMAVGPMALDYFREVDAADDHRLDSAHERTFATLEASAQACEERAITVIDQREKERFGLELKIAKWETKADVCGAKLLDVLHARATVNPGGPSE